MLNNAEGREEVDSTRVEDSIREEANIKEVETSTKEEEEEEGTWFLDSSVDFLAGK